MKRKTVGYSSGPMGDEGFSWASGGDTRLDGVSLTNVAGLEILPDDVVITKDNQDWEEFDASADQNDGFDITAFMNDDDLYGPVPDLEWLDPSQTQDPARLPHSNSDIRDELLGQWDANQPKFLLRQARDIDDLRNPDPQRKLAVHNPRQLAALQQYGLQLAHRGASEDVIRQKLGSQIQGSGLTTLMEKVAPHVGLAGRFYVLASAFPRMENGKWKQVLQRMASARFIVVPPTHPLSARHNFLGREIVSSVPLDRIWSENLPALRLADSEADKLASQESVPARKKLQILRRAHLMEHRLSEAQEQKLPIRETYISRYDPNTPLRISETEVAFNPELMESSKTQSYLDNMSASGFLSKDEVEGFSGLSFDQTVLAVRNYIMANKKVHIPAFKKSAMYQGPRWEQTYRSTLVSRGEDQENLDTQRQASVENARTRVASLLDTYGYSKEASASFMGGDPRQQLRLLMQDIQRGHKIPIPRGEKAAAYSGHELTASRSLDVGPDYEAMRVQAKALASRGVDGANEAMERWRSQGWLSQHEFDELKALPPQRALYAAQLVIFNTRRHVQVPRSKPSKAFEGAVLTAQQSVSSPTMLSEEESQMALRAREGNVRVRDIKGAVRWVREQMNTGWAGLLLTSAYEHRFASNLREAAAPYVDDVRRRYEGLSGHLMVDAGAYSNGANVDCDQGANRHKSNNVKLLLAMSTCDTCVFQSSEGRCSKYGKTLVTEEDIQAPEIRKIRAANLRKANMTDSEKVAGMFANEYDGDIFDIQTPDLDLEAYPEAEDVDDGEILMGGFILP